MNFKEEYVKAVEEITPDKRTAARISENVMKLVSAPERHSAVKRVAITGGALAACAVIAVTALNILPSLGKDLSSIVSENHTNRSDGVSAGNADDCNIAAEPAAPAAEKSSQTDYEYEMSAGTDGLSDQYDASSPLTSAVSAGAVPDNGYDTDFKTTAAQLETAEACPEDDSPTVDESDEPAAVSSDTVPDIGVMDHSVNPDAEAQTEEIEDILAETEACAETEWYTGSVPFDETADFAESAELAETVCATFDAWNGTEESGRNPEVGSPYESTEEIFEETAERNFEETAEEYVPETPEECFGEGFDSPAIRLSADKKDCFIIGSDGKRLSYKLVEGGVYHNDHVALPRFTLYGENGKDQLTVEFDGRFIYVLDDKGNFAGKYIKLLS